MGQIMPLFDHIIESSKAGVRNAMTMGPVQGQGSARQAVYYGDLMANVYALDAQTGRLLWTRKVERNYLGNAEFKAAYAAAAPGALKMMLAIQKPVPLLHKN